MPAPRSPHVFPAPAAARARSSATARNRHAASGHSHDSTAPVPSVILALAAAPADVYDAPPPCLLDLGGTTLVARTARMLAEAGTPALALVAPPTICAAVGPTLPGMRMVPWDPPHPTVGRGPDATAGRAHALRLALDAVGPSPTLLLADAERGLTPAAQVQAVLAAQRHGDDAVLPLSEMTDSVKSWDGERLHNVDRSLLGTPQSPQLWRRESLERALAHLGTHGGGREEQRPLPGFPTGVDGDCPEIRAMLALGGHVRWVPGSHRGFAVLDRLTHWQAQIAIGQGRETGRGSRRPGAGA